MPARGRGAALVRVVAPRAGGNRIDADERVIVDAASLERGHEVRMREHQLLELRVLLRDHRRLKTVEWREGDDRVVRESTISS